MNPPRRFHVVTLGCKLNQYDSARAEGILRDRCLTATDDPSQADVIVVNTCTVTARADAEGRRLIRRMRALNPTARIVATGCYAERAPEELRRTTPLDELVGHRDRHRLGTALLGDDACATAPLTTAYVDSTRAWLRVQEGCDLACSYCIIPSVRGPGRSVAVADALAQIAALRARGVREIGLTGINVGSWGRDLSPRLELADLLEAIVAKHPAVRIRLNSLEPRTVTARVLALMRDAPATFVPHLQIPLQAGSDGVLARMARNYRTALYRETIERAVDTVPDIAIGADVISGFPGESGREHEETTRFLEDLPLAYLHVFSYSVRPGTRAASMPAHVDAALTKSRTATLRAVGAEKARRFRERMLGRTLDAITLQARASCGATRSLTGNYIEVLVPEAPAGTVLPVTLTAIDESGAVRGRLAS